MQHKLHIQKFSDDAQTRQEIKKIRTQKLAIYKQLLAEGCSQATALKTIGISRATYYRRLKRQKLYGDDGLEPGIRCPHTVRKPEWDVTLEPLIINHQKTISALGKGKNCNHFAT